MNSDTVTDRRAEEARAERVAATVTDPELPMLTLADLGVLRDVRVRGGEDGGAAGTVVATITPTYSGCPAMTEMRHDLHRALRDAGFHDVRIETALSPPWSSDWITERGRAKLADVGISPPGTAPRTGRGPVPLTLRAPGGGPAESSVRCPRCGSADTELTSTFGPTACRALWRCRACAEPFEHVKEI